MLVNPLLSTTSNLRVPVRAVPELGKIVIGLVVTLIQSEVPTDVGVILLQLCV